jgi:flagellar motility protein MotE (MotC chaperone)
MMFADAIDAVNPAWGWQAICFLIAAVSVVASVAQIANGRKSQRREVSLVEGIATTAALAAVKQDLEAKVCAVAKDLGALETKVDAGLEKLGDELRDCETRITSKGEERVVKVHDRINDVLQAVSRLEGRVESSPDGPRRGI